MWDEFSDFELACLFVDYGFPENKLDIASILPLKLNNRAELEKVLTEYEMAEAFGE